MIQVVQSNSDGSMKYCQVHDILRDLAVRQAEENNFQNVCSKPDDLKCCKAHRVAIHYVDASKLIDYNRSVRSLLLFGHSSKLDFSKYSVLRVLSCMKGNVGCVNFKGSRHLRYLRLDTSIYINRGGDYLPLLQVNRDQFWKWVKSMNYLETLDLQKSTPGSDLSKYICSIWGIKTLRHVLLPPYPNFVVNNDTPGPPASVDLMKGDAHVLEKVVLQSHKKLKVLTLNCYLDRDNTIVLDDGQLPPYLLELHLECLKFESDPMPVLEKLGSLKILSIHSSTIRKDKDVRIRCSNGGFKQLEELILLHNKLEKWEIQIGAMPMLKYLRVGYCDPLPPPAGLIQQPSLRYLNWYSFIEENYSSISEIFKQRPDLKSHWVSSHSYF